MPERKERQERLFMYRCPECGCGRSSMFTVHRTLIDRTVRCSGSPERIEVRPASESESLRRALEGLMEQLIEDHEWVKNRKLHAARSDLNSDEERGWDLALSGMEYRLRTALGHASAALSQTSPEPEEEE
jgi:hypothetical protein